MSDIEALIEELAGDAELQYFGIGEGWMPVKKDTIRRLIVALEASQELCNFAWSSLTANCNEAKDNLNRLVNNLRAALRTRNPPMTDPLAIHRLRRASEISHEGKVEVKASDLRWMLDAWDKAVECLKIELEDTPHESMSWTIIDTLTAMGQL